MFLKLVMYEFIPNAMGKTHGNKSSRRDYFKSAFPHCDSSSMVVLIPRTEIIQRGHTSSMSRLPPDRENRRQIPDSRLTRDATRNFVSRCHPEEIKKGEIHPQTANPNHSYLKR